jgi:hypothetical protein
LPLRLLLLPLPLLVILTLSEADGEESPHFAAVVAVAFWVGAQGFSPAKNLANTRGFSPGPFVCAAVNIFPFP